MTLKEEFNSIRRLADKLSFPFPENMIEAERQIKESIKMNFETIYHVPDGVGEHEEEDFDSHNGSVWTVSVDEAGCVSILKRPNIHWAFFENGETAEDIGLPFELVDFTPGVYKWTCNMVQTTCHETGMVDGCEFDVVKEECLWSLK
jgi:hypothetical protein